MRSASLPVFAIAVVLVGAGSAGAQTDPDDCGRFLLNGTVLECVAGGFLRGQLRTGTFIAGSAATGELLAQALELEIATAPVGSSSGGLTYPLMRSNEAGARRPPRSALCSASGH